jgi:hypothetical protein
MPHSSITEMDTEDPSHGQAFHSSSLHILRRDNNLRRHSDVSVWSGAGNAAAIEERDGALQGPQE